jgi:hypothetical protein
MSNDEKWNVTLSIRDEPIPEADYSPVLIEVRADPKTRTVDVVSRSGFPLDDDGAEGMVAFLESIAEAGRSALAPHPIDVATEILEARGYDHATAVQTAHDLASILTAGVGTDADLVEVASKVPNSESVRTVADSERAAEVASEQGISIEAARRLLGQKSKPTKTAERMLAERSPYSEDRRKAPRFDPKPKGSAK